MSEFDPQPGGAPEPAGPPAQQGPPPPWSPAEPWFAPPESGGFAPPASGPYPTQPYPVPPPTRRRRGPVIGFVVGAVVVALGVGGYVIARNVSAGNNKPVATSAQDRTGGISVSGRGITMTFPKGWVNVPTSPNDFEHFIKVFTDKYGHVPAALKSEMSNPALLHTFAMLVFRFGAGGSGVENLDALVTAAPATPSKMEAQIASGEGPAQFGATDVRSRVTSFSSYPALLVTYTLRANGMTFYGAQSYVDGPGKLAVVTVTSLSAGTSESALKQIVGTITFSEPQPKMGNSPHDQATACCARWLHAA